MQRRLPPLNSLRAFEAAARHLSITKAAEELSVTPAAISHQVKGLEEYLGVPLFRRLNKALLLTDAGQACLPALREGFDLLADAMSIIRAREEGRALTVSVPPSFAAKWLVPRLDHFTQAHPGIDVRIDATLRLIDLHREDVDLAIRYGPGGYEGLHVDQLLSDEVFPVCSPRLMEGEHPLKSPDDLRYHTLLHFDGPVGQTGYPDWRMWLRAAGVEDIEASRGPRFSLASHAVVAATEGQGVALVGNVLAGSDIAAGRLVKPFEVSVAIDFKYYLVCPTVSAQNPKVVAFRNWLLEEAKTMTEDIQQRG